MGIQGLNKYIQNNCGNSVTQISLLKLRHKTISIDASIYMYKFVTTGNLIEGIYSMVSTLQYYNITPIFVFDGKTPDQKTSTLIERKKCRNDALISYNSLVEEYKTSKYKKNLYEQIVLLKRQCIKLTNSDIINTKELLKAMGVLCYQAESEADIMCAELVKQGVAYACMSDDSDMFVYECDRILRYFSLQMESCILYDYNMILDELNLTNDEFKIICIASGTDYNRNDNNYLSKTLDYHKQFKQLHKNGCAVKFLKYLVHNVEYIDMDSFLEAYKMFEISNQDISYVYNDIANIRGNKKELRRILTNHNFVFVEKL